MRNFKRPNVLLIYTDQQRADSLSCTHPDAPIRTPNLDALAADGAVLTNYFVNNPVCAPSRMSFLTGRYCSSVGVGTNGIPFPKGNVPLNQLLKPYGYDTAQIGKLHFDPHAKRDHRNPTDDYGFDTFILSDEPGCYDDAYTKWVEMVAPEQLEKVRVSLPPAAYHYNKPEYSQVGREVHEPYVFEGDDDLTHQGFVASEVIRYIKEQDHRKPFFCIAGFYAPHTPINPPQKYIDMVDVSKIRLPVKGENEPLMEMLRDVTEEDWQKIACYYYALVAQIDDLAGQIITALKEAGLYEDTIIIFTTDHGEYLGDHGKISKGMPGYDCIIHVPFIIKYAKEIQPGTRIEQLTEGVDFVPTVLDYCGIQIPQYVQGKSLRPLLSGKTDTHKDHILVEFFDPYGKKMTTVRDSRYKYYCSSEGEELLFDLEKDPNELCNVVQDSSYAAVLSEMRLKMIISIQKSSYPNMEKEAEY